jgi:hypothetical protein
MERRDLPIHELGHESWWKRRSRALGAVAAVLVAFGFYNFFSFMVESDRLGGDAVNGHAENGHYFVSNHGRDHEVTAEEWARSRRHAHSVMVSHPLAMIGMAYLLFTFVFPRALGRAGPETPGRVRSVAESGPLVASISCSGKVGSLSLPLRVSVHPGGVIIKPLWMPPRAVLAHEISSIRRRSSILRGGIEVEHSATDVTSPIMLIVRDDSPVAQAIRKVAPWLA